MLKEKSWCISLLLVFLSGVVLAEGAFNLAVDIPKEYLKVEPGNDIWFTFNIMNLENKNRMDITLDYEILDGEGNRISGKTKTVAIETKASFVDSMNIPEDAAAGTYTLVSKVVTENNEYETKSSFTVVENTGDKAIIRNFIIGAVILVTLIVIFILVKALKRIIHKGQLKGRVRRIVKRRLK